MTRVGTLVRRNFEPLMLSVQVVVDLLVVIAACLAAFALRGALVVPEPGVIDASLKLETYSREPAFGSRNSEGGFC